MSRRTLGDLRLRVAARTRMRSMAVRMCASFPILPLRLARAQPDAPFFIYGIYRSKWASVLARAIASAGPGLAGCHLWALDAPTDELRKWTRASGAGLKFDLLNALLAMDPAPPGTDVVFTDDDFRFAAGGFGRVLAIAELASLDMAQPAHLPRSFYSHPITVAQPRSIARLTGTVEVGPVFTVSRTAINQVLPFPSDAGMGWGLETIWAASDLICGVVDAVPIKHMGRVGSTYDQDAARANRDDMLAQRGFTNERPPWVDGPKWRRGEVAPSWVSGP